MITVEVVDNNFQIEVGAANIVSGGASGTATATNSLSTVIGTVSVPSGGTANIPITDSSVKRSDLTTIATVPAETDYTVADSVVTLKNTVPSTLSTTNVKAASSVDITAPNGTATVKNSLNTTIDTANVPSGANVDVSITDSTIKRSDLTNIASVPAETNYTVADSVVTLVNTVPTTLSTTNVLADKATTITAPNGTANAKNSANTTVGTAAIPSGATANVSVADSTILRSDATTIATTPATVAYTVADTPVRVEYLDGTLISNTNVKAASSVTIQVPNPLTLQDNVDASTSTQIVTAITNAGKECDVTNLFLANYASTPRVLGQFAPVSTNALSIFVNSNTIYVLNNTQIDLYNATTFAFIGSVLGFTRAGEIAFSSTTYAVADFGASRVRIMNIATNIEVTSFAVITSPLSICFNDTFTLLYVATLSAAGSVSIYNTSGVLQGTVTGFDTIITEIRAVGTEWWVLTGTGTTGASTQRVRKMRFSDNTQVSTSSLGTVTTIGAIRAMVVTDTKVYVSLSFGNQNVYRVICYNLDFTSPVTLNVGLVGTTSYGLTYNSNKCNSFIMLNPNAETCYNLSL
jgi:hypothetical protein